jgi:hypothetical protein
VQFFVKHAENVEEWQFRPVSNAAVDDDWSALRFRHQDKVKTRKVRLN